MSSGGMRESGGGPSASGGAAGLGGASIQGGAAIGAGMGGALSTSGMAGVGASGGMGPGPASQVVLELDLDELISSIPAGCTPNLTDAKVECSNGAVLVTNGSYAANGMVSGFSSDTVKQLSGRPIECSLELSMRTSSACRPARRVIGSAAPSPAFYSWWELKIVTNEWSATEWRSAATLRIYGQP